MLIDSPLGYAGQEFPLLHKLTCGRCIFNYMFISISSLCDHFKRCSKDGWGWIC